MYLKTVSGVWEKPTDNSHKGTVDANLTARAVGGSEAGENYEVRSTVNIASGNAALIVNYDLQPNWEEWYLEMVLDQANDAVQLDAVIRNPDGSEKARITISERLMTLSTATDYEVRLISLEIADGVYAVYGYIDDFLVVEAEDLQDGFDKGMFGFECLGAENQNATFTNPLSFIRGYSTLEDVKEVLEIERSDRTDDAKLAKAITSADALIDRELSRFNLSVPSTIPDDIVNASKYFASWLFRKRYAPHDETGQVFKEEAERFLETYKKPSSDIPFIVGEATS